MTAILVTQRETDWHASIEGDAARWGCGRTINEAIGNLFHAHQADFGVEVRMPNQASQRPEKCEECGTELHEFDGPNGEHGVSCDTCGWSWDDVEVRIEGGRRG